MSQPPENPRPDPASTTARTSSSAQARSKAASSSRSSGSEKALSLSGRFKRTIATPGAAASYWTRFIGS